MSHKRRILAAGVAANSFIRSSPLQFLYHGEDPPATGSYSQLPWRPGLLTPTNSTC